MDKTEVVYVIRNLPYNLEKEKFSSSISSAFSEETVKIIEYIQGKKGTKEIIPTRCYVKIYNKVGTKSSDSFLDFMDGKSFVNSKGIEEECSVENVPFFLNVEQTKKNTSMGTLESSKTYQSFLKQLDLPTDSVQNFDVKGNTTQESWPIVDMILRRDNKKEKKEKKDREKKRKRESKRKRQKRKKEKEKQKQLQLQQGVHDLSNILSPSSSTNSISTSTSSQNLNNSSNNNKTNKPKRQPKDKSQTKEKKPRERKPKDKSNSNNNNNSNSTTTTTASTTTTTTTTTSSTPTKSNKTPKEKQFREKRQPERKPKLVFEPKVKQPTAANPPSSST